MGQIIDPASSRYPSYSPPGQIRQPSNPHRIALDVAIVHHPTPINTPTNETRETQKKPGQQNSTDNEEIQRSAKRTDGGCKLRGGGFVGEWIYMSGTNPRRASKGPTASRPKGTYHPIKLPLVQAASDKLIYVNMP